MSGEREQSKRRAERLLARWHEGDKDAFDELFSMLHGDLRRNAHSRMRREREGHTMQTDDLVNKLYLKMAAGNHRTWRDLTHFEKCASSAMRHLLIDHARVWQRRGDGPARVTFDDVNQGDDQAIELGMEARECLAQMHELDPDMAHIFELKYRWGYTLGEIADELKLPINKVKREWQIASRFMAEKMGNGKKS